ncbi:hypothetical protein PR048_007728 [Dryococelus australis]|uniref:GIY-YIG domain-containing protein n=1 Tax=Dryococelus australis TaxID=614101 RepID=A0ABQ9HV23_9NEOP|nr:hypothetical protein PR048_007728 [Dryococelus australis]
MERHWNERAGEEGDPRVKPPTSVVVRHDSYSRKSGGELANRSGFIECIFHETSEAAVVQRLEQPSPIKASHQGEPGSIPRGVDPGFSHVGIVLGDTASRWVFSGISRFFRPCILALLHTHFASPSSTLRPRSTPTQLGEERAKEYSEQLCTSGNSHISHFTKRLTKTPSAGSLVLPLSTTSVKLRRQSEASLIISKLDHSDLRAAIPSGTISSLWSTESLAAPGYICSARGTSQDSFTGTDESRVRTRRRARSDGSPVSGGHSSCRWWNPHTGTVYVGVAHPRTSSRWMSYKFVTPLPIYLGCFESQRAAHMCDTGRPRPERTVRLEEVIRQHIDDMSSTSTRSIARQMGVSYSTVWDVLWVNLSHAYRWQKAIVRSRMPYYYLQVCNFLNPAVVECIHAPAGLTQRSATRCLDFRSSAIRVLIPNTFFFVYGTTVAERLARSPPTKANRVFASRNRAGRCRWSAGFLGDLPFTPPIHSGAAPYSFLLPSSALKTSLGSVMKGRRKREIPEKTRRPTALSGTITIRENPVTRPGIEPGLPWSEGLYEAKEYS